MNALGKETQEEEVAQKEQRDRNPENVVSPRMSKPCNQKPEDHDCVDYQLYPSPRERAAGLGQVK